MKKAYALRERVSMREKFYIESHYHDFVTATWKRRARSVNFGRRLIHETTYQELSSVSFIASSDNMTSSLLKTDGRSVFARPP
jgi:hypothetical protein